MYKCHQKDAAWTNVAWANVRSIRTEIFLIWTNVARANVAMTNVTVTVGKLI